MGTKEVSDTLVRYLGHFAQPTSKEITKQLTKVVTSSRGEIIMMSRAQKTTYFGRIANATLLLTASFRFFCYAVKSISKPADVKILKTLQKSVDSYISLVITGDSRYQKIKYCGSGVPILTNIMASTKALMFKQLNEAKTKHYQYVKDIIATINIEAGLLPFLVELAWKSRGKNS